MKLLVLGGMHGNEPLGMAVIELLRQKPIDGVDCMIANPRAVQQYVRFTESDLNRSFSGAPRRTYEDKRAMIIKRTCARYDLVLDFHNTFATSNDCSFVGVGCDPILYEVSLQLGLDRCIEATYDCINKACPNTLSVEISLDSERNMPEFWYGRLEELVNGVKKPQAKTLQIFRFAGRIEIGVSGRLGLSPLKVFSPISETDCKKLGYERSVYPIFIGSSYTEYEATLITKERNVQYE